MLDNPYAPALTAISTVAASLGIIVFACFFITDVVSAKPTIEATWFSPETDLLIIGIPLTTAWCISIVHRCNDAVICRYLYRIYVLMVIWLCLALGKITFSNPLASSLFWYAQCLPLIFIPLFFFFCALRTTSLDTQPRYIKLQRGLICLGLILFSLAMTNNFHHFVFELDLGDPNWETAFSYGYGYYSYIVLMLATTVAAVMVLGASSRGKTRRRIVWIALLVCGGLFYWTAVIIKGEGLHVGNNAIAGSILYIGAIELCLDLGFFPSARQYTSLFRNIPFDLKIISSKGEIVYSTALSRSLDNTTLARLSSSPFSEEGKDCFITRSDSTPGYIYKLYHLTAGLALLTENSAEFDRLKAQLRDKQRTLANQNEVLSRTHEMQALLYRQQRERELERRVEADLAATIHQIKDILDNRITYAGEDSRALRIEQLNLVKFLVAYSKRKGMLALAAAESDTITGEQLNLIARESMADLNSVGIECGLLVAVQGKTSIDAANMIYDSFYDCIISVFSQINPVMMVFISTGEDDALIMRATIECAIGIDEESALEKIPALATSTESWTAVQAQIARDLEKRLSKRECTSLVALKDGRVVATVKAKPQPDGDDVR